MPEITVAVFDVHEIEACFMGHAGRARRSDPNGETSTQWAAHLPFRPSPPSVGWRNDCQDSGGSLAKAVRAGKHHLRSDPGHRESRCAALASGSEMFLRPAYRRDVRKVCRSFLDGPGVRPKTRNVLNGFQ